MAVSERDPKPTDKIVEATEKGFWTELALLMLRKDGVDLRMIKREIVDEESEEIVCKKLGAEVAQLLGISGNGGKRKKRRR